MSYHLRDAVFSAFNQKRPAKWRRWITWSAVMVFVRGSWPRIISGSGSFISGRSFFFCHCGARRGVDETGVINPARWSRHLRDLQQTFHHSWSPDGLFFSHPFRPLVLPM